MKSSLIIVGLIFVASLGHAQDIQAVTRPNPSLTPGVLCTASDPNFQKYDYPEHVARCARNVGDQEKQQIATSYGNIPKSQWSNYEFDHLIPLCAGGSDDVKNLWPQPIAEAHKKDVLENDICLAMQAGTLKQADAVQKVHDWFNAQAAASLTMNGFENLDEAVASSISYDCSGGHGEHLRFSLVGAMKLAHVSFGLRASGEDEDHEVLRHDAILVGKISTSAAFSGWAQFSLSDSSEDRFELYLPKAPFDRSPVKVVLMVSYDRGFPQRLDLSCNVR